MYHLWCMYDNEGPFTIEVRVSLGSGYRQVSFHPMTSSMGSGHGPGTASRPRSAAGYGLPIPVSFPRPPVKGWPGTNPIVAAGGGVLAQHGPCSAQTMPASVNRFDRSVVIRTFWRAWCAAQLSELFIWKFRIRGTMVVMNQESNDCCCIDEVS